MGVCICVAAQLHCVVDYNGCAVPTLVQAYTAGLPVAFLGVIILLTTMSKLYYLTVYQL